MKKISNPLPPAHAVKPPAPPNPPGIGPDKAEIERLRSDREFALNCFRQICANYANKDEVARLCQLGKARCESKGGTT